MKSAIYTGHIRHRRFKPTRNEFKYGLFMLYLDLEELPHLFDTCRLWSYERANLACWRRSNYLGPRDLTLRDAVRYRIEDAGGEDPGGPVRMLTHLGYFGICYNPVSFYYCFNKEDTRIELIIAEINNTPWKERHAYILTESMNESEAGDGKRYCLSKSFHVSPFMPMNVDYDWRFSLPGEKLTIHMIDNIADDKHFDATLTLSRKEMDRSTLNAVLLKYPFMTARVIAGIHYQALRLWIKKIPFHEHPERRPADQKDLYASVKLAKEHKKDSENKLV